ncbi:MAG TPA: response regulator [Leptospiraceae bacterium]|nr:response regulator [Leptospirales bacterium]HMU82118.1 response regulator [Leptospiraceae bacterium]HMW61715.1 response regulator [Leptospiraceae bacterium]HMX55877.1 response regulator [Leptospiraceae bacterium]HMY44829.1 response regulator [Leptospiraceae bacterium]
MTHERSTIVIVDDDPLILEVLQRGLASQPDMSVLIFPNGESYLEFFASTKPDLLLLDAGLPGISGLEVLARIRARYSRTELPVIFISSDSESAQVVSVLEAGANDFVGKPVDLPVLIARMKVHLSLPGSRSPTPSQPSSTFVEGQTYPLAFLYCQVVVDQKFSVSRQGSEIQSSLGVLFDMYSRTAQRYNGQLWLRKDDAGFFVFHKQDAVSVVMCAIELMTLNVLHGALQDRSRDFGINIGLDLGDTVYRADPSILQSAALNKSAHLAKEDGRGRLRISQSIWAQLSPAARRYFDEGPDCWIYRSIF